MALNYEIVIKGGDKAFSVFNNLNKISEISTKIDKIYQKMGNKTLAKVNNKLKDIKKTTFQTNETFASLKDMMTGNYSSALDQIKSKTKDSFGGVINIFNKGFSRGKSQGAGMFKSIIRGVSGVTSAFKAGAISISGILGGLATAVAPLAIAVVTIIAAVYSLKKMWQINFLGMQTTFHKVVGSIKSAWGKFNAFFIQFLRKMEPLAKILLAPLIMGFKYLWAILKGLFGFAKALIMPFIEMATEIGSMFKGANTESKTFESILKGITWTLTFIGKILGFIIKVGLAPIIWTIRAMSFFIKRGMENWKKFQNVIVESKGFKYLVKIIKYIQALWKKWTESSTFKFLIKAFEMIKKGLEYLFGNRNEKSSPSAISSSNYNNISSDNRKQNITFNTGRATSTEETKNFANILAKQLNQVI